MRRLFEGGVYSNKYGKGEAFDLIKFILHFSRQRKRTKLRKPCHYISLIAILVTVSKCGCSLLLPILPFGLVALT